MKWNVYSISITLLMTLTLSGCSALNDRVPVLRSTTRSKTRPADDVDIFPHDPAEKFCNPDYVFEEGDVPDVTSRCAPLESFVCSNRDPWHYQLGQRCRGIA